MIASSENIDFVKKLADVMRKPAKDPIRNLCTTIASSFPYTGTDANLQFILTGPILEVKLSNSIPILALRFEIEFARGFKYRVPELGAKIQNLNTNIDFQDNTLTFVVLDIVENGIRAGEGTILNIPLEGTKDFKVVAAYTSSRANGLKELEYTVVDGDSFLGSMALEQNFPNPFNNSTKIEFQIPNNCEAKVVVYDVDGALIRTLLDSSLPSGTHKVEWDGKDDSGNVVESGVYLYKLYAGVYSLTKRMVFAK